MADTQKQVQVQLPLDALIETLCKLPPEDLAEVKRRIEERMDGSNQDVHPLEDTEFWDTELGREMLAEADSSVTREDVWKATSSIKGSLAAAVIAERDER